MQKRGKGGRVYRVPNYLNSFLLQYTDKKGLVIDIVRDPLKYSPLAKIKYPDNSIGYLIAPEGLMVGQTTDKFVAKLSDLPESSQIFALETVPNSGPKLCRSSGVSATLIGKSERGCIIMLPSKHTIKLNPNCYATIGTAAGGGRTEKPFMKAGTLSHFMHARGKHYPRTSGVAMNAVNHPYGGGYKGLGRPKSVARNTPAGRKVGAIASRRTGRKGKVKEVCQEGR